MLSTRALALARPRTLRLRCAVLSILMLTGLAAPATWAAPNDIRLTGLLGPGGVPDDEAFFNLTQELGLVMTPLPHTPAETTGQSGFDIAVDTNVHVVNFWEDYWRRGRVDTGLLGQGGVLPTIETVSLRARKGFVLPIPLTSEVDVGATWILESSIFVLGVKGKMALTEGIFWLPDVAVDLGLNRMVGAQDLDLTTITAGASISKGFAIFGDFEIVPFLHYESVFVDARTRLIDPDPTDTSDIDDAVTFTPQPMAAFRTNDPNACTADVLNCVTLNRVDRVSGGMRFQVSLVQVALGLDANIFPVRAYPLTQGEQLTGPLPIMLQGGIRFGLLF